MSAMRSASSRTSTSTAANDSSPRSMRSMRRPGVPTIDVDALLRARRSGAPCRRRRRRRCTVRPTDVTERRERRRSPGWRAHGSGRGRGRAACAARPCRCGPSSGRPKARVLPDPVLALPQHVAAGEAVGDGQGLDGERFGDALGGQGAGQLGRDAEIGERGAHVIGLLASCEPGRFTEGSRFFERAEGAIARRSAAVVGPVYADRTGPPAPGPLRPSLTTVSGGAPGRAAPPWQPGVMRILVVEDEASIAEALADRSAGRGVRRRRRPRRHRRPRGGPGRAPTTRSSSTSCCRA